MKLRVFTWNLHAQRYSPYEWLSRLPIILKTIKQVEPDIIVLQEVEPTEMKEDLIQAFQNDYQFEYQPKVDQADGILLLYKNNQLEIIEKHSIILANGNQQALITHFNSGCTLTAVHLKSKARNADIRKTQIDTILDFLHVNPRRGDHSVDDNQHFRNQQNTQAFLIIGDFNEDIPESEPNAQVFQTLQQHGYHHVYPTDTKTTKKIDHEGTPVHRKIDWIWIKPQETEHVNLMSRGQIPKIASRSGAAGGMPGLSGGTQLLEVDQTTDLPNLEQGYPSDHHPLAAEIHIE